MNWLGTNFRKEGILKSLFSDEKFFDFDGVHNSENERVSAINHADADEKGSVMQNQKFSERK